MKVLIALSHPFSLWNAPADLASRLQHEFPQHNFQQISDYAEMNAALPGAEVAVAWSLRPENLQHADRLRWIHSTAAAVHQLMFRELVESDIAVTNARSVHAPVVAEHALALVFALAKRLPQSMRFQAEKKWAQQQIWDERPTTRELAGATALVLGMGSIGSAFTRLAKAVGMKVIAVREHPERGADGADALYGTADLHQALPLADFVVLCAPVTPATKHILNAAAIARMHSDSYVVNVSRGPLIDDDALLTALRDGKLAGAALDVFAEEPLPPSSPYWEMKNVLVTPHTAAVTERLWQRQFELIAENLRRYASGQELLGLVDKRRGY